VTSDIIMAGFGGQGILMIGTCFPSPRWKRETRHLLPGVRGGDARRDGELHGVVSDEEIGSPWSDARRDFSS